MPELLLFKEGVEQAMDFLSNRERGIRIPDAQVTETMNLIYNGTYRGRSLRPHEREFMIKEALTTSDFPYLFGDVLHRQMLASYTAVEPVWKKFCRMSTVNDFRTNRRIQMAGGDDVLEIVAEKGEYLASPRTEVPYTISVNKYGRQFDVSWESLINDDLNALKDTPERFARAATRTEHSVASNLYVHNVVLATAGRGNLSANPLTIANLETAIEWFAAQTDANTQPIYNRPVILAVPPALELTARQILTSALKMWIESAGGAAATPYPTTNVLADLNLQLAVDPMIQVIDTANGNPLSAVGGWYLFSDPKQIAALEVAHLSGHERPEVCMKASDKVTLGGGAINPLSGDFATDNTFYRVRHVFGGTTLDWRAFYFGGHLD